MASNVYANAKLLMATDSLGWVNPLVPFRAMLMGIGYTYNHVHTTVADVVANEVSSPSYARIDVLDRTASLDLPGDRALLDARNPLFPALSGVSPAGLIIYKQVGGDDSTPSNDPLVCFIDFAFTSTDGTNFLVELDPDGAIALTEC